MRQVLTFLIAVGLSGPALSDDFGDHPATDLMRSSEPITLPKFNGRDAAYRNFRTRITEGLKEGPNFAGHFTIIGIGCGTHCIFAYVANARNGEVFPFPYGGEENYQMSLDYRIDSRLVKVSWLDFSSDSCIQHEILWNGEEFEFQNETRTRSTGFCNN